MKASAAMGASTDWNDFFPPVAVKELRQALRSAPFLRAVIGQQLAGLTIILVGLWHPILLQNGVILFIAFLTLIPGGTEILLYSERRTGNLDLLIITGLPPRQIIFGKWLALMGQTVLLTFSFLPFVLLDFLVLNGDSITDCVFVFAFLLAATQSHALGLVISSLSSVFYRHLVVLLCLFLSMGLGFTIYEVSTLWYLSSFVLSGYWAVAGLLETCLMTAIILRLHGSLRPAKVSRVAAKMLLQVPNRLQVRSRLDWGDWLNPISVKEFRHGLRSGFYFALVSALQCWFLLCCLLVLREREYRAFFWFVWFYILSVYLPMRGNATMNRERRDKTVELLLMTGLPGRTIVRGIWICLMTECLLAILSATPWAGYMSGYDYQLSEVMLLVSPIVLSVSYWMMTTNVGISVSNEVVIFLLLPTLALIGPAVFFYRFPRLWPSQAFSEGLSYGQMEFSGVFVIIASILLTTSLLRRNWRLSARSGSKK